MRNIRILSLMIALFMCVCLVGCGEKDEDTGDTSSASKTTSSVSGTSSASIGSESSGTSSKQSGSSSSVSSMTDEELGEILSSILSGNGYEVGPGGGIELPEDVFE